MLVHVLIPGSLANWRTNDLLMQAVLPDMLGYRQEAELK